MDRSIACSVFLQDVNLTVTVEEQNVGGFDMIDDITVPIRACDLFSPSTKYYGIYGIASITLAYTILTTSEQYRNCVDPSEPHNTLISMLQAWCSIHVCVCVLLHVCMCV